MASVMEKIFPVGSALTETKEYRSTRFSPVPTTFILGSAQCMKTAMLVQAGVTEAASEGQVLYVAPRKLHCLPPSVHGMPTPAPRVMQAVKFLYAQETRELLSYLASLHMIPARDRPSLIIIDDLHFFSQSQDCGDAASQMMNVARILSLAQESAEFCSMSAGSSGTGQQCSVLVAWTQETSSYLKLKDVEVLAKDLCHYVWTVQCDDKHNRSGIKEYRLVEDECGHICTITFSSRRPNSSSHYLLLHHVVLQTPTNPREGAGTDNKGTVLYEENTLMYH